MARTTRPSVSPQARGRELAREGTRLWREQGSVRAAAAELMHRHEDIPSIQAHRYACGLSQDQAADRYNEVTGHRTSLGGTTINAWETWARGKGAGSPRPTRACSSSPTPTAGDLSAWRASASPRETWCWRYMNGSAPRRRCP